MVYDLKCMARILNYVLETIKIEDETMRTVFANNLISTISHEGVFKKEQVTFSLMRCIREGFIVVDGNYKMNTIPKSTTVYDVTLRGYMWLTETSEEKSE